MSRSGLAKHYYISPEEAKKLVAGTLLYFPIDVPGFAAKAGAMAKIIEPFDGTYWNLEWVRNSHDHGQSNGEYTLEGFDVFVPRTTTAASGNSYQLHACNCSKSDFNKYGCRYLKSPDPTGSIHF